MTATIATLEALLAVQELQQEETEAAAGTPKEYQQYTEQSEQKAIEEREEPEDADAGFSDEPSDLDADVDGMEGEGADNAEEDLPADGLDVPDDEPAEEDIKNGEETTKDMKDDSKETMESFMSSAASVAVAVGTGAAGLLVSGVSAVATGLARLGIEYGPTVAGSMFKGVTWLFSRTGDLVYLTSSSLSKYIDSFGSSSSELQQRLNLCVKNLGVLANAHKEIPRFKYENAKVISSLKIANKTAFDANIKDLSRVIQSLCHNLANEIETGYTAVERLAELDTTKSTSLAVKLMEIDVKNIDMVQSNVPGYEPESQLIEQYRNKDLMPGDLYVVFNAPGVRNGNMDDIAQAYRQASMFMALNRDSMKIIHEVDSLGVYNLLRQAQTTQQLLNCLTKLNERYGALARLQPGLAYSVKKLFVRLADEKTKVRLSGSFIEPMFLRASLASGVMLTGMMDVTNYGNRVAAASIKMIEDHLRKMS